MRHVGIGPTILAWKTSVLPLALMPHSIPEKSRTFQPGFVDPVPEIRWRGQMTIRSWMQWP